MAYSSYNINSYLTRMDINAYYTNVPINGYLTNVSTYSQLIKNLLTFMQ